MRRKLFNAVLVALAVAVVTPLTSSQLKAEGDPHAYFEALTKRPDLWKAYSLRSQDELMRYRQKTKEPMMVTYDPANDSYPLRQDAAKVVITGTSLQNQVHLPIGVTGGSVLLTWDAWWGKEYMTSRGALNFHKA